MKDILKEVPFVVDYASKAMKNIGIEPRKASVEGRTDGSAFLLWVYPALTYLQVKWHFIPNMNTVAFKTCNKVSIHLLN